MLAADTKPPLKADEMRLREDGAERRRASLDRVEIDALRNLADSVVVGRSGTRLFGHRLLTQMLGLTGSLGRIACTALGSDARPVRAIMFDKSAAANWLVGWHQDRTIAVRARADVVGFGPWSIKSGTPHVEPPFALLEGMITLRAHIDDCDEDNAPLLVVPGSHRFGRVPAEAAEAAARQHGAVACFASAGDVWVYATPILHASERARVPRRRRVLQVDFAAAALPSPLEWYGVA